MRDKEINLLRRFADSGDAEAFSQIVQRHSGMVYSISLRVLDDRNQAADITQETFLELIRKAGEITTSLPLWLHKVATHKAIDIIRRDSRRRRREARYSSEKPLETTKWEDLSVHIDEELENLGEQTRDILIRRFFEGKSTTEIAEANEISQPTASRKIETGVAELRSALRKKGLLVAAGALGTLLLQNAAQAAPATVVKELGKLAIAGSQAAAASAAGSATAASSTGVTASTGVMVGIKAKVIAATAAAAVGVGGAITVKEMTEAPAEPAPVKKQISQTVKEPERKKEPESVVVEKSSAPYTHIVSREEPEVKNEQPVADAAPVEKPVETGSEEPEQPPPSRVRRSSRRPAGGYGGYYGLTRPRRSSDESSDPNDNESRERRERRGRYSRRGSRRR